MRQPQQHAVSRREPGIEEPSSHQLHSSPGLGVRPPPHVAALDERERALRGERSILRAAPEALVREVEDVAARLLRGGRRAHRVSSTTADIEPLQCGMRGSGPYAWICCWCRVRRSWSPVSMVTRPSESTMHARAYAFSLS